MNVGGGIETPLNKNKIQKKSFKFPILIEKDFVGSINRIYFYFCLYFISYILSWILNISSQNNGGGGLL